MIPIIELWLETINFHVQRLIKTKEYLFTIEIYFVIIGRILLQI